LVKEAELRAECKEFRCEKGATDCCCRRVLYNQPDFVKVESLLETTCKARGVGVIFWPKFHCEISMIESCWGYTKRSYREYPPSSQEAELERNLVSALESVPLASMCRYVPPNLFDFCSQDLAGSQDGAEDLLRHITKVSMGNRPLGQLKNIGDTEHFLKVSLMSSRRQRFCRQFSSALKYHKVTAWSHHVGLLESV
jgi:hypothetical protein